MEWELTAAFWPVDGGFMSRLLEFPDVVARGATLDEARENLRAAIRATIEARRAAADDELAGSEFIRETMVVTSSADGRDLRGSFPGT